MRFGIFEFRGPAPRGSTISHLGAPAAGNCALFRLPGAGRPTTLARSVNPGPSSFSERLREVRDRIESAARRSGRKPAEVVLVGVVKGIVPERVREAVDAGLRDLGENRVQEAETKIERVGRHETRWHMVGHLQRNKAARAVDLFDRVHSVDSVELAEALARRSAGAGIRLPVLIQVNVSAEATKHGAAPDSLEPLATRILRLPGLELDGLMSIGPPVERPEDARPYFAHTRELRDGLVRRCGAALPQLSMGMSADFEVAVEEGSTLVRLGAALFGPRAPGGKA